MKTPLLETTPMPDNRTPELLALTGIAGFAAACTPTVKVEVAPITIYAKLDADVRIRLDEDVKALIQKNPDLF